jgi:adenosylcobyric acid synthase
MIQGTGSHVGKSVLVTAFCRLFLRRGLRVAPFKAQNMSNNSFVTPDGREIGRAQAVQAAACRLAPRTEFNPVLIKPEGGLRAQLVVNGVVAGTLTAEDFGRVKRDWFQSVCEAFARLAAGSPAEINLREHDIVNMRMAREARAPVILVGDIDRGGVLAALVGTMELLEPEERRLVKGFLVNKFRGSRDLLAPGIREVEKRIGVPCLGVVPHWGDLQVPQEDSLGWEDQSTCLMRHPSPVTHHETLIIGVADVPAISNFTDFEALAQEPDVALVRLKGETGQRLDALIFPGTKSTAEAVAFVKARGLDLVAKRVLAEGGTVLGLCGGYQLLGTKIRDPHRVESREREVTGLGLLDVMTGFARKKVLIQVVGVHRESGCPVEGYQIHMGRTKVGPGVAPFLDLQKPDRSRRWAEGAVSPDGRVIGTYVHGLFDQPSFRRTFLNRLRSARGWAPLEPSPGLSTDQAIDRLADFVAEHVGLAAVEAIVEQGA